MTSSREPTVFWCSRCKGRHAGEDCATIRPPTGEVYLLKAQTSMRYDPKIHGDFDKLLHEGWHVYDPLAPGDAICTDTHRRPVGSKIPCMHGYTWWCSMAPDKDWYPDAPTPEARDKKSRQMRP